MGETTAIEWTDATWNPWRGCDKVSPGCAHCYMFRDQLRYGRDPYVVVRAADGTFKAPMTQRWLLQAEEKKRQGLPHLVFTCSWSDFFHEDADDWRAEAWEIIKATAGHTYQVLTKRPERIADHLPDDWGDGYPNVWLGTSIENRRFAHRADQLREIPAVVRFISAEPLLGPLVSKPGRSTNPIMIVPPLDLTDIDWLIVGGESGPKHRRMDPQWVRDLRDAVIPYGRTHFFFKQWGGPRPESGGRELDGRTWDEIPKTTTKETAHA